jgi:dTDP-4-amino-4,6-dideoxygalactose transaminase
MSPERTEASVVPFLSLRTQHESLKAELLRDFSELIDTGAFTNGPAVAAFEFAFSAYTSTKTCVGMASGLDALRLALIAAGLGQGAEVLLPANTFVATAEAVSQAGGIPVLVDASESDLNLDPDALQAAITSRTGAFLPVHLYGQMADMRAIKEIAARVGVPVIEDACQAHGAVRDGLRAGRAGLASAFSFYPGKNLGAMGDAGALVSDDFELAERARALREHGQSAKYEHDLEGYTARLDTIQALVLLRKLELLDDWNQQRRRIADHYMAGLSGLGDLQLPPIPANSEPVWHLFVVRTERPERLATFLREEGIQTGRHYPTPIHLTASYAHLGYGAGSFPVSEALARECLSVPIFPGMSEGQTEAVISAIRRYFKSA